VLELGHDSATSHSSTAGRHTAPWFFVVCVQTALVPLQRSFEQMLPSSVHVVLLDLKVSVGQVVLVPVHVSVMSHSLTAARQTAPALPVGCVHAAPVPLQTSRVQAFPSSVQAVSIALNASDGQAALVPEQISAMSHSPALARQTLPAGARASPGQAPLDPSQVSATSHEPAAARQIVPAELFVSEGQAVLVPVHVSAGSQPPVEARQTVPAFPAG